jgi:hypothetical protein
MSVGVSRLFASLLLVQLFAQIEPVVVIIGLGREKSLKRFYELLHRL